MAQDTRKALDEKTRKLTGGKIEDGKEHAAYQESQQQLLAIQAEQQQNLAVARAESKASFDNNQTLAQAAELGAISAAEAEQAAAMGAQAGAQLNPATQQILSKYGAGQPKFQRSQSHSQQVTKQNITINNSITSNTTNDVKVPANIGGPLQGRPLQFKAPSGEGSVGKFKTWISAAFARQNEEGAKRDREYRHRESSLTRSASKMMKKLEDIGKTIGSRMDPRKIGSTWQSQLKTLLLLFGFGYLTSNWTKVLETVSDIEQWVRNTWNYFSEGKFISDFKEFIGGNEDEPLLTSLYELFLGNDGFLGRFKDYLKEIRDDRKSAISMVKFPEINFDDMIGTIKGVGEYIGNLLTAIVSGTEGTQSIITNQIETAANKGAFEQAAKDESTRDTISHSVLNESKTIQADKGIEALISGDYRGLTRYSIDDNGNLTNQAFGAEATVAQASDISRIFDLANHGKGIRSTELAAGLQRLYNSAKLETQDGKGIPVTPSFLKNWFKDDELKNLQRSKDIRKVDYYAVARKKTEADFAIENADPLTRAIKAGTNQAIFNEIPVLGDAAKKMKMAEGAGVGAGIGTLFGMPFVGAAVGGAVGWAASTPEYQAISEYLKGTIDRTLANDYRVEYVREPRPGDKILTKPGTNEPARIPLWEITDKAVQKITDKITGKENTNIDINDESFVTSVQSGLQESARNVADNMDDLIKKAEQYRKEHPQDFNNNRKLTSLRQYQSELKYQNVIDYDINQAYQQRDQFNKEREEREAAYKAKHDNDRVAKLYNNMSDAYANLSTELYDATGGILGSQKLNSTQKKRAEYALARFMREGLTKEQAAGIVGNMMKESSLDPQSGAVDSNGKWAGGIVGWNGDNYAAAKKYFGKDLKNVSFEDQLEYLIKEMKGEAGAIKAQERSGFLKKHGFKTGANVMDVMKTTTGLQDSTNTFERIFEGSGDYAGYWTNKGKPNAQFHEGDKNRKRLDLAASVYKSAGGDLSNVSISSNPDNTLSEIIVTGKKKEEDKKAKSFLEIFKEKVTSFITNLGGIFSAATDKVNEVTSPIVDKVKDVVLTDGYHYNGPITKEFTDYETYKMNQDKLPKDLPSGLSYDDWKNRVYDMTGSMPQNLDLSPIEASKQKAELKKDSKEKEIIEKYSKPEETSNWVNSPEFKSKFELEAEDEKYREMIPLINDPVFRNSLTETEIAKVESLKAEGVKPVEAKKEEPETVTPSVTEVPSSKVDVAESSYKDIWNTVFNTQSYEKKEDEVKEISVDTKEIKKFLGQILGVNSANGMIMAQNVDATNNGARANAGAFMGLAKQIATDSANRTKLSKDLRNVENNTIKQLA